ncbi:hypothetical protein CEUSTIGMA_g3763.t1 [Chlamydomonas eustigma]|uniref:Uncharacterized protein n=1 Tax=Chlamydomonas eustigma TaxID=1157962 RepID=A0A250WZQ2_9CHLO|nr:hypothetical protein CEUSTIGMA_g3763.t1 [Chlamydomonas eustigma]|eukprot:GAX76317.1 hypothetical protein CEUSTIGMA_g3763.t1 [Chlamydomonas eustigma]
MKTYLSPHTRDSILVQSCCIGGGNGGAGGTTSRCTTPGDDDDDQNNNGGNDVPLRARVLMTLTLLATWTLYAGTPAPASAESALQVEHTQNSTRPPHHTEYGDEPGPLSPSHQMSHLLSMETGGELPWESDISRLKRLQREVFATITELKQKLEDMEEKGRDNDMYIPHDGAGVQPRAKRLSQALKYRSATQLSGSIDATVGVNFSQVDNAQSTSAAVHGPNLDVQERAPHTKLILQTLWPNKKQSITAMLGMTGCTLGNCTLVNLNRFMDGYSSGCSTQPATSGSGGYPTVFQLKRVLVRREEGPIKILLAPLGGNLQGIARKINPSGEFGLTRAMRQGHELMMVKEGGVGAAGTWVSSGGTGALSISAGHFFTGNPCMPHACGQHSVAQLSFHNAQWLTASLVLSSTTTSRPPREITAPISHAMTASSPASFSENRANFTGYSPSSDTASSGTSISNQANVTMLGTASRMDHKSGKSSRCNRAGASASISLGDAAVASGWVVGGDQQGWGLRVATVPDQEGCVFAAGAYRRIHGVPRHESKSAAINLGSTAPMVYEVSASIPFSDGIVLTPGVVVCTLNGASTVSVSAQSTWNF